MHRKIIGLHRFINKGDALQVGKKQKINRAELYSLLLLAGGKSSRMGEDKAGLLLDGESFLSCQIKKAEKLGIREVYVSGHDAGGCVFRNEKIKSSIHIQVISDIYRERGPLGGLHACMKGMDTPYCLVLPVDVPQLPVKMLEDLLLAHEDRLGAVDSEEFGYLGYGRAGGNAGKPFLAVHGERTEPLMGIYPTCMADCIGEQIQKAPAPVFRILDAWGYDTCRISVEEWRTKNINTPEDYRELLMYMEKRDTNRRELNA